MPLLTIPFPAIDPVALSIGPFAIKWYGLAYMAGLLLGWLYVKRLVGDGRLWATGEKPFAVDKTDDLLLAIALGVILGGRLGYVLFYKPGDYLAHPLEIFAVWKGGMSFHGGIIGSMVGIAWFARRHGVDFRSVLDLGAAAAPLGLFFGRLANFVNGELWGRPSTVGWSMVFPEAGPVARHPSQLYEALSEGMLLFLIGWWLVHKRDALKRPGLVAGVFAAGYGLARSFCELFREPDYQHWLTTGWLTAGIVYSLPLIAAGFYMIWQARAKPIVS